MLAGFEVHHVTLCFLNVHTCMLLYLLRISSICIARIKHGIPATVLKQLVKFARVVLPTARQQLTRAAWQMSNRSIVEVGVPPFNLLHPRMHFWMLFASASAPTWFALPGP